MNEEKGFKHFDDKINPIKGIYYLAKQSLGVKRFCRRDETQKPATFSILKKEKLKYEWTDKEKTNEILLTAPCRMNIN